ncbi:hypothetical protein [Caudoviricetes sp.]|nr:hypothetical protein [Caudoviricetes sp.]
MKDINEVLFILGVCILTIMMVAGFLFALSYTSPCFVLSDSSTGICESQY